MRYGQKGKIYVNEDDEKEMIGDLNRLKADARELLTKIGYYDREKFLNFRPSTSPGICLSTLKNGKVGFYPNEFIELLRLYELHYPEKYEKLLTSHSQEYSELFGKANKVLNK